MNCLMRDPIVRWQCFRDGLRDVPVFHEELDGKTWLGVEVIDESRPQGVFLFTFEESIPKVHSLLLSGCRGLKAVAACRAGLDFISKQYAWSAVCADVEDHCRHIIYFMRRLGFVLTQRRCETVSRNGRQIAVNRYTINF